MFHRGALGPAVDFKMRQRKSTIFPTVAVRDYSIESTALV